MRPLACALLLIWVSQICGVLVFAESALKQGSSDEEKRGTVDSFAADFCGVAQRQGRRAHQEDRVICMPELILPGFGGQYDNGFSVGLFGVFDGHNGAKASEMASTYLPHRLYYHTWSIITLDKDNNHEIAACVQPKQDGGWLMCSSLINNDCFDKQVTKDLRLKDKSNGQDPVSFCDAVYRMILKEALFRALVDIDSAFSNESWEKDRQGGSTAVVVLKAGRHLLVANIGDSKAFVCSSWASLSDLRSHNHKFQEEKNAGASMEHILIMPLVKELTLDHRPDRWDEKERIEAAGGFISTWGGVPRVNGQLAITRSIGDVLFKKYGVIAEPEFTEWQEITFNESFLFLASDGIFETMKTQDVCNLLKTKQKKTCNFISESESLDVKLDSQTVAEAVVDSAFESGSRDNLAVVVYSLTLCPGQKITTQIQGSKSKGVECDDQVHENTLLMQSDWQSNSCKVCDAPRGLSISRKEIKDNHGKMLSTSSTMASGLLLRGSNGASCYELVEAVPRGVILPLQTYVEDAYTDAGDLIANLTEVEGLVGINVNQALPYGKNTGSDGQLEIYHEHLVCLLQPLLSHEDEVCLNPERFATYLRLIEAVPLVENSSTKESVWGKAGRMDPASFNSYTTIHRRYVLTKNVGRGGFGEVWFAVPQNCSTEGNMGWANQNEVPAAMDSLNFRRNFNVGFSTSCNVEMSTNSHHQDEIYVLKRILIEKGDAFYLSGIREQYFGEVFTSARNLAKNKHVDAKRKKFHGDGEEYENADNGLNHIVRYVESFQVDLQGDLWLVFWNEGYPLSSLLYTVERTAENGELNGEGHIRVLQPSDWWRWLKTTEDGQQEMRNLIYQLVLGVKACHDRNITHRDIKPENMMVQGKTRCAFTVEPGQLHEDMPCKLSMRIIDFGSAIDTYSLLNLYGPDGPSRAEETAEYTPPESFLKRNWLRFHGSSATMYLSPSY